jgi:hypothetical protein
MIDLIWLSTSLRINVRLELCFVLFLSQNDSLIVALLCVEIKYSHHLNPQFSMVVSGMSKPPPITMIWFCAPGFFVNNDKRLFQCEEEQVNQA